MKGIFYAGRYLKKMEEIFAEYNLPIELTRLPFVESSFNILARSKVGASGIWQFMRGTGKKFLKVNTAVDERNDPLMATHAAAKLLLANYNLLKSWPLAITAYNHGAGGVRRAIRKTDSTDIVTIINNYRSRTFGFASQNFYAEFLAALRVELNHKKHFGTIATARPIHYETIELPFYISLASLQQYTKLPKTVLRQLNPAFTYYTFHSKKYIPQGYKLRIPVETKEEILAALENVPKPQRLAKQRVFQYYRVTRGDTLSYIARRFRISMRNLMQLNQLRSRHRIYIGQRLRIAF